MHKHYASFLFLYLCLQSCLPRDFLKKGDREGGAKGKGKGRGERGRRRTRFDASFFLGMHKKNIAPPIFDSLASTGNKIKKKSLKNFQSRAFQNTGKRESQKAPHVWTSRTLFFLLLSYVHNSSTPYLIFTSFT